MLMQQLFDYANTMGVSIEWVDLASRDGEYREDLKLIRLRAGMSPRLERFTLAHELAHAHFGDVPSMFPMEHARQEERADEWAAERLINMEQYREVEQLREGHVPAMAHDLGVVTRCVYAYQRLLARLGDSVYLRPRMGAGCWAARVDYVEAGVKIGVAS